MKTMSANISRLMLLSTVSITLTGCLVTPKPIQNEQHAERASSDMGELYKDAPALTAPLTLSDAISRGLLYNFDFKMSMFEEVLQSNQLTLANFNMLPRIAANAGYGWRSDERATTSISLRTRQESLEPSYSEERVVTTADLGFSWNLLDFGLSYYTAKQQSDRVLSAVERRRRVMNNMVKEIQDAYWRALTAQTLLPEVEDLIIKTDQALIDAKKIEDQRLKPPIETLEYRRSLLQVTSQLKSLHSELIIAKAQLGSLINLAPTQDFVLAQPDESASYLPAIPRNVETLQNFSLVYRPELREETYQERIDKNAVTKEIIRIFPGVSVLGSTNYDSNRFLAFQNYQELGARATWNLISVLQAPKAIETAKTQVEIAQLRRLALSAAVLSQVTISYSQYAQAFDNYEVASELSTIEQKMLKIGNDSRQADSGTELEKIQLSAQSLASRLQQRNALSQAKAAYTNLLVSVGVDLVPSGHAATSMEDLSVIVDHSLNTLLQQDLSDVLKSFSHFRQAPEKEEEYKAPEKS